MTHADRPQHDSTDPAPEDPAVTFSRRTAFRFAAGAAGAVAVTSAGAAPAAADADRHATTVECMADLEAGS